MLTEKELTEALKALLQMTDSEVDSLSPSLYETYKEDVLRTFRAILAVRKGTKNDVL